MDISIKVLTGKGCKCCDNLIPKMDETAKENGYNVEYVDVGDVEDLPIDLTGIPYIIVSCDGIYVNSWQGDMSKELLQLKIQQSVEIHNKRKLVDAVVK